jgi:hypothetical protein
VPSAHAPPAQLTGDGRRGRAIRFARDQEACGASITDEPLRGDIQALKMGRPVEDLFDLADSG